MKLEITKALDENRLVLFLKGRLDSITSSALIKEIDVLDESISELIFDMKDLEYISSNGLRASLIAYKKMLKRNGSFSIVNMNDSVKDVFKITGMLNYFTKDE